AILSTGTGWHVKDLQRAAAALGHEATAVDFRKIGSGAAVAADSLAGFETVLVRTMPPAPLKQAPSPMDLLPPLPPRAATVLNPPGAVEACVDKYLATARVEAAGLKVPPTIVCQHAEAALQAFEQLAGDVIIKPLFGSEGRGMVRVSDPDLAWRTCRALERTQSVLYLQKFIPHEGWDTRVFVLGGQVLAAMLRRSNGGWRTNVAQGGTAEEVELSPAVAEFALRAAAGLGAPMAGVDLLLGKDGEWYVLEVNAVPGWRALAPI